jgi:hypothetical protein
MLKILFFCFGVKSNLVSSNLSNIAPFLTALEHKAGKLNYINNR